MVKHYLRSTMDWLSTQMQSWCCLDRFQPHHSSSSLRSGQWCLQLIDNSVVQQAMAKTVKKKAVLTANLTIMDGTTLLDLQVSIQTLVGTVADRTGSIIESYVVCCSIYLWSLANQDDTENHLSTKVLKSLWLKRVGVSSANELRTKDFCSSQLCCSGCY